MKSDSYFRQLDREFEARIDRIAVAARAQEIVEKQKNVVQTLNDVKTLAALGGIQPLDKAYTLIEMAYLMGQRDKIDSTLSDSAWQSIETLPPKRPYSVLVTDGVYIAEAWHDDGVFSSTHTADVFNDVTHWMRAPTLPVVGQRDKVSEGT